ncbi:hypothetical protein EHP00_1834 [Ecytonucleospora hepatopenaei]|uniref:Uncharacterized protein n=1 Tax=Ecytonucleospora hepatopenaei TaxID=646526 RepID=A0A1W0E2X1_9MICR|nr:hypothetical protein EHP00_1834 [Ecytonucleospora hepatopenaei]
MFIFLYFIFNYAILFLDSISVDKSTHVTIHSDDIKCFRWNGNIKKYKSTIDIELRECFDQILGRKKDTALYIETKNEEIIAIHFSLKFLQVKIQEKIFDNETKVLETFFNKGMGVNIYLLN